MQKRGELFKESFDGLYEDGTRTGRLLVLHLRSWLAERHVTPRIAISARGLSKYYGQFAAVNSIDFTIYRGEIFGFLGPNGAGKTTTLKMLTCTSPVGAGELRVNGKDVQHEPRAIKSVLGVVSQADSLDPGLNVIQNLVAYARFFNVFNETATQRAWEALDLFQLRDKAHQSLDELSGGMRRRLLIARSLLHAPSILILDEPTTGLDPQTRLLVWARLTALKSQGRTILLTTHYMAEAAYLCDRLVVMDKGNILVEGSPLDLIQQHVGDQVVEVRASLAKKQALIHRLSHHCLTFDDHGDAVILYGQNSAALQQHVSLDSYQIIQRPGNLEDVFLRLTGRGLREA
ncbi:Linearmycin resistance ATP-binding protein LnrL [Candidatus Entotheonellaceae bacterium PAL068K]